VALRAVLGGSRRPEFLQAIHRKGFDAGAQRGQDALTARRTVNDEPADLVVAHRLVEPQERLGGARNGRSRRFGGSLEFCARLSWDESHDDKSKVSSSLCHGTFSKSRARKARCALRWALRAGDVLLRMKKGLALPQVPSSQLAAEAGFYTDPSTPDLWEEVRIAS